MWNKCYISLILFSFLSYSDSNSFSLFNEQQYQSAQRWIEHSLITHDNSLLTSTTDIQTVLNLFFFSYQRSVANIQAQEAALPLLHNAWHGWRNISQRRRNPSITLPYAQAAKSIEQLARECTYQLELHDTYATTYDVISELLFKKNILENKLLINNIQTLKDESRSLVTTALIDVQNHITELMNYLQKHRYMRFDDEQLIDDLETTRSKLFDYIQQQMPVLAFQSFNKTDILFLKTSQKQWEILSTTQELSNLVWQAVEKARGSFYFSYYVALYERMQNVNIEPLILFDQNGLIDPARAADCFDLPDLALTL